MQLSDAPPGRCRAGPLLIHMSKTQDKLSKHSRLIGPEDLRAGHYVTIAEMTWQLVVKEEPCAGPAIEPRIATVTGWPDGSGWPLRVISVCLPYAIAETSMGKHVALDLRRHRLSRLSKSYGEGVFAALKKPAANATAAAATT